MAIQDFLRKLNIGRDDGGYVTGEIPWTSERQSQKFKLDNGVERTLAVPTWVHKIMFVVMPGGAVWCGHGDVALVLANNTTWTNEASELNPILRPAFDAVGNRISTVRLLSETDDTVVNVIFYPK